MTQLVHSIFRRERIADSGDLNIIFVGDPEIRKMNKHFLNEKGTTDVIAFRYPVPPMPVHDSPFGDVYICVPEAIRNARVYKISPPSELRRLVAHGVLHLLGYDDHRPQDRALMWKKQEFYVSKGRRSR